ncbi:four-carbon acid sugar kinase family protein [Paramicrobacterium chengjingii]|uniref:four-carbon acid sugar kinase family protein n=1 Tax=Paramicrobacterium chengjingii TaxID=2769067 RepID=UPI0014249A63|nr:four-carbon acid sugar kinase family protein [Microbacterium chengjingii]
MKTVVLDDDPTGTQSATGVRVLLTWTLESIRESLAHASSIYIQTNSRALTEQAAVELIDSITSAVKTALPDEDIRFILRGDSTLRGHVFAESERLLTPDALMVFVPAFPTGGRTTEGGVHYATVDGVKLPAGETEYASDPVFPFRNSDLAAYVREKSTRTPHYVPLAVVRGPIEELHEAFAKATPGSVVVPDATEDDDIVRIARAIEALEDQGQSVVVRSASPLAAEFAGVRSERLLTATVPASPGKVLLVCGSHTTGATAQLEAFSETYGKPITLQTSAALTDAQHAGHELAKKAHAIIGAGTTVSLASERARQADHNTLDHGDRVMTALSTAARDLAPSVDTVIAKGGITSAEIARVGLGATSADVVGQLLPGISLWEINTGEGRTLNYVVVPGNVGGPRTLIEVACSIGMRGNNQEPARSMITGTPLAE